MPKKYRQKYRISTARLQKWDYRRAGAYFITICTENREPWFGEITNGQMHLSPTGTIADVLWHEIKNHHQNVQLDAFIVMPNHIHGILVLENVDLGGNSTIDDGVDGVDGVDETSVVVETGHALSLPPTNPTNATKTTNPSQNPSRGKPIGKQRFQNIGKNSISSIIGSYKSAVTKHVRRLGFKFGWQSRFYDHIIRNEKSLQNIRNYIIHNPENWKEDKFHQK